MNENIPDVPATPVSSEVPLVDKASRQWGMIAHVSAFAAILMIPFAHLLGPLVVWLLKREVSSFVDECGKEALNFQISMTIWGAIAGLLCFVLIGFPIAIGLGIAWVVLVIIATLKADKGEIYRYPITIRFLK